MKIFIEFHTMIAIYFYLILIIFLANKKRLKLMTTRIFYWVGNFTFINLILDFLVFIGTHYSNIVPQQVTVWVIKLYFVSCMLVFSTHFLYVIKLCTRNAKINAVELAVLAVPNMFVWITTIVSELSWHQEGNFIRIDSNGVYAVFVVTLLYSAIGVFMNWRYWKSFSDKIRTAQILTAFIWCVGFLLQMLVPVFMDMIGVAFIALMYVYFFYFENTNDIVDEKTGFFNKRGFKMMSDEYFSQKDEFHIINIGLDGLAYVRNQFGNEYADAVLKGMQEKISGVLKEPIFLFKENDLLLLLVRSKEEEEQLRNIPSQFLTQAWNVNGVNVKINAKIRVIRSELIQDKNDIFAILHYITSPRFMEQQKSDVMWIDEDILNKEKRMQSILTMLQYAIENDGFAVYYQPIFDARTNSFSSAEALIRLKDTETIGFVSPEEFISIAEDHGIVSKIGNIVYRNVCRMLSEESMLEKGIQYIEVNLSAKEAIDVQVTERLIDGLKTYHLPAGCINLEVTETASVTSKRMLQENMKKLRKEKFTFSMDDFGTGYSNLAQIADLGYEIIKLDKSLIWPCFEAGGEKAMIILKNMIQMIQELGMHIVAEGIENEEQAAKLKEFGVNLHQGFYYARPMPEKDFVAFVKEKNEI